MSTCNRLDLQTLGSQPIMPKNLPDNWHVHFKVFAHINVLEVRDLVCSIVRSNA